MQQSLSVTALPALLGSLIAQGLRRHAVFYLAILTYLAVGKTVATLYGLDEQFKTAIYLYSVIFLLAAFVITFFIGHALYVMAVKQPKALIAYLIRDYRERLLRPERLINGILVLLILPIFFSSYTSLKVMITSIQPFTWDETFTRWDALLHGGTDPWVLLHLWLGFPLATVAINVFYNLWFFVLNAMLFWQAFTLADPRLRMQYLLTMVLIWSLLGSLLATLLSSAGPTFFHHVSDGPNPFEPLMTYLRATAEGHFVPAVFTQDYLWYRFESGGVRPGGGVSAMPSMHVASSFLFVLLSWRVNRWLGWSMTFFFLAILIGSVHLGWHYAIDGYVAAPLTWMLWLLAGRLLDLDPLYRDAKVYRDAKDPLRDDQRT